MMKNIQKVDYVTVLALFKGFKNLGDSWLELEDQNSDFVKFLSNVAEYKGEQKMPVKLQEPG